MARVGETLDTLVSVEEWVVFSHLPPVYLDRWLCATAARAQLRKYRKHPLGPKKPPVPQAHDPEQPHVSVARLLAEQKRKGSA
jgi:hypothetical protein